MKVSVTQSHIDNARPRACFICPVAVAIRDAGAADVEVHRNFAFVAMPNRPHNRDHRIRLPKEVRAFIQAFDAGAYVEPFTFDLPIEENDHAQS